MNKEIAFLIYLYDKELEIIEEGSIIEAAQVSEIREKFADMFGINEAVAEQFRSL
jgi:hypothetical protein